MLNSEEVLILNYIHSEEVSFSSLLHKQSASFTLFNICLFHTNFLNYLTCFDTKLNFNSTHSIRSFICSFNCGRWQVDFHKSNFTIRMWNSLENFLIVQRVLVLLRLILLLLPHKSWGFCLACRRAHPQLLLLLPLLFLLLLQRTLKCKANKLQHSTHTRAAHQQQQPDTQCGTPARYLL